MGRTRKASASTGEIFLGESPGAGKVPKAQKKSRNQIVKKRLKKHPTRKPRRSDGQGRSFLDGRLKKTGSCGEPEKNGKWGNA